MPLCMAVHCSWYGMHNMAMHDMIPVQDKTYLEQDHSSLEASWYFNRSTRWCWECFAASAHFHNLVLLIPHYSRTILQVLAFVLFIVSVAWALHTFPKNNLPGIQGRHDAHRGIGIFVIALFCTQASRLLVKACRATFTASHFYAVPHIKVLQWPVFKERCGVT